MPQEVLMSVTELPVVAVTYENAGPAPTSAAPAIAVQAISRMRYISIPPSSLPEREAFSAVRGRSSTVRWCVGIRPTHRQSRFQRGEPSLERADAILE